MNKVLLHICCGVCAFSCIEQLKEENFYVEGFFFNPNIYPYQEYKKRKDVLETVRESTKILIREGTYNASSWFALCKKYYHEPEKGVRCQLCFRMRLEETFRYAKKNNFDFFTTTLTISPYKNSTVINQIGAKIGGAKFLQRDFKKKDGFKKTLLFANKYKVYHQNYCGCIYSLRIAK